MATLGVSPLLLLENEPVAPAGLRIGAYAHHSVQSPYRTLPALLDHLVRVGITELRPKTHQHLRWSGFWESGGPWDLEGIAAFKQFSEACKARGVRVYPWCVPMGEDIEAEAQLAAKVATVNDCIDFDIEPYDDFWPGLDDGSTLARIEPFFRRVRELLGRNVEITLDFPARDTAWEWGRIRPAVERAAPYVDRFALQSYFGLMQALDAHSRVTALGTGRPIDHITDVPHLREMLGAAQAAGRERLLIWREADIDAAADRILLGTPARGPVPFYALQEVNQFNCANYDTTAECNTFKAYTCAAAALACTLSGYGYDVNISAVKRLIHQTGDAILTDAQAAAVGSTGGLQNRNGQSQAVADVLTLKVGPATTHAIPKEEQSILEEVLRSGRPIICQLNRYTIAGGTIGHYAVLKRLAGGGVEVADSNTGSGKWPPVITWDTYWTARGGGRQVWVGD